MKHLLWMFIGFVSGCLIEWFIVKVKKLRRGKKVKELKEEKDGNGNEKETTYEETKIGKTLQLWEKGFKTECDADKKKVEISYYF